MGRVNYGHKLLADTQKGIRTGICRTYFMLDWQHYALLDQPEKIDFSKNGTRASAFYAFDFNLEMKALKTPMWNLTDWEGVAFIKWSQYWAFLECRASLISFIFSWPSKRKDKQYHYFWDGEFKDSIHLVNQPTFKNIKGGKFMTIVGIESTDVWLDK